MGSVTIKGKKFDNVEVLYLVGVGDIAMVDPNGRSIVKQIPLVVGKGPGKDSRVKVTGKITCEKLLVQNCIDFKGHVGTLTVSNVLDCSKEPRKTISARTDYHHCSFSAWKKQEDERYKYLGRGKRNYDRIVLEGAFKRVALQFVNVEFPVILEGSVSTMHVGNCAKIDGTIDCAAKVCNRIVVHNKKV